MAAQAGEALQAAARVAAADLVAGAKAAGVVVVPEAVAVRVEVVAVAVQAGAAAPEAMAVARTIHRWASAVINQVSVM